MKKPLVWLFIGFMFLFTASTALSGLVKGTGKSKETSKKINFVFNLKVFISPSNAQVAQIISRLKEISEIEAVGPRLLNLTFDDSSTALWPCRSSLCRGEDEASAFTAAALKSLEEFAAGGKTVFDSRGNLKPAFLSNQEETIQMAMSEEELAQLEEIMDRGSLTYDTESLFGVLADDYINYTYNEVVELIGGLTDEMIADIFAGAAVYAKGGTYSWGGSWFKADDGTLYTSAPVDGKQGSGDTWAHKDGKSTKVNDDDDDDDGVPNDEDDDNKDDEDIAPWTEVGLIVSKAEIINVLAEYTEVTDFQNLVVQYHSGVLTEGQFTTKATALLKAETTKSLKTTFKAYLK
ncbi:MAG: hypothetical protein HYU99_06910 [Deltaproteobacteria bacterium]|nr:hypothetical protein [Deltaproteobacteria bacterium]